MTEDTIKARLKLIAGPEVLRRLQKLTRLGIADCKKIADNPDMYF